MPHAFLVKTNKPHSVIDDEEHLERRLAAAFGGILQLARDSQWEIKDIPLLAPLLSQVRSLQCWQFQLLHGPANLFHVSCGLIGMATGDIKKGVFQYVFEFVNAWIGTCPRLGEQAGE